MTISYIERGESYSDVVDADEVDGMLEYLNRKAATGRVDAASIAVSTSTETTWVPIDSNDAEYIQTLEDTGANTVIKYVSA